MDQEILSAGEIREADAMVDICQYNPVYKRLESKVPEF